MAEQLYRVCPECKTIGGTFSSPCLSCSGIGYVPVDAPEPLTGEEIEAMARVVFEHEWPFADYDDESCPHCNEERVRATIAALPERFGVRIAALSQEDHDGR